MERGAARDLLFERRRRLSSWVALAMWTLCTHCLLPPGGEDPPANHEFPPEISLDGLNPPAALVFLRLDCEAFRVSLDDFIDRDDDRLLIRWVVDNNTQDTFHVRDNASTCCAGEPRATDWRFVPRTDFKHAIEDASASGKGVGVLSLFVTDAMAWANVSPDNTEPNLGDLGQVASADGAASGGVVEARWTFIFQSTGECPQ